MQTLPKLPTNPLITLLPLYGPPWITTNSQWTPPLCKPKEDIVMPMKNWPSHRHLLEIRPYFPYPYQLHQQIQQLKMKHGLTPTVTPMDPLIRQYNHRDPWIASRKTVFPKPFTTKYNTNTPTPATPSKPLEFWHNSNPTPPPPYPNTWYYIPDWSSWKWYTSILSCQPRSWPIRPQWCRGHHHHWQYQIPPPTIQMSNHLITP